MNSEFSFSWTGCQTKAKEHSLPYYLLIAGGRQMDSSLRVLAQNEMWTASSRIWTQVTDSISYDDNIHYAKHTSDQKISTFGTE